MGKKNNVNATLGNALIKDRFSKGKSKRNGDQTLLHTSELNDGYDWGRLNLKSVTEESSFQEFLSTAELAGTEFEAEKLNVKYVKPSSIDVTRNLGEIDEEHKNMLKVPRRPKWSRETTSAQLQEMERESFLEWRRKLAVLQEEGYLLTPYEKNLEFWRQLWRVIERSDVVVQIVDARNPLLFRCSDLEKYVKEVDENKENVLLINKSDFLTGEQRQKWADYFTKEKTKAVFYSAIATDSDENEEIKDLIGNVSIRDDRNKLDKSENSSKILGQKELINFFKTIHEAPRVTVNKTTIGLVGYPNVGKSSTVNSLLNVKKVAVSSTPGKTKHFQTFILDEDLILCDCPGLVMPSFVSTKSDMIINGILGIDQMRDHVPPINLVASIIPRSVLEEAYGLILPKPRECEDPDRAPDSEELLNAFGYNRGFMTHNGQPDNPRSARYILKDFVSGKLLYCRAPPGVDQSRYHIFPEIKKSKNLENADKRYVGSIRGTDVTTEDIDKGFFKKIESNIHRLGRKKILMTSNLTDDDALSIVENHCGEKPWKKINKHKNKNKREKLRRVYKELDMH